MGRISKRKAAAGMEAPATPKGKGRIYRAGIYARLSSDAGENKNESIDVQVSIAKNFIEDFNRKNSETIEAVECYSDLGKTGSNFKRDGFLRMMQDIRLGEIDCVVVKDLSRFGRNYLEAGNYIEKIFPFLGVRFIAVSDGLDTGADGGCTDQMASEIKNLVNDMYAKDFSAKARASLQQRRQSGSYVGGPAPYGYAAAWEGKTRKLVPDENTADIVRHIFSLFVEKKSYTAAADDLNSRRINPPMAYRKTGEAYCPPDARFKAWDKGAVSRIVKSRTYAGTLEQGKTSITARDEENRIHKKEEEWHVTENAHEPLVSAELFEKAQEAARNISSRAASCSHPTEGLPLEENIFNSVLYCGVCARKMTRDSHVKTFSDGKRERRDGYFCLDGGRKKAASCPQANRISKQELLNILLPVLRMEFAVYLDKQGRFAEDAKEHLHSAAARAEQKAEAVRSAVYRLEEEETEAYADYRGGKMTQKAYAAHRMKNENLRRELEGQAQELEKQKDALKKVKERYLKAARSLAGLKDGGRLTAEMVDAIIEKIYVYPGKRIEIQFRYTHDMLEGVV